MPRTQMGVIRQCGHTTLNFGRTLPGTIAMGRTVGGFRKISFGRQVAGNISREFGRQILGDVFQFGRQVMGARKLGCGRSALENVKHAGRAGMGNIKYCGWITPGGLKFGRSSLGDVKLDYAERVRQGHCWQREAAFQNQQRRFERIWQNPVWQRCTGLWQSHAWQCKSVLKDCSGWRQTVR